MTFNIYLLYIVCSRFFSCINYPKYFPLTLDSATLTMINTSGTINESIKNRGKKTIIHSLTGLQMFPSKGEVLYISYKFFKTAPHETYDTRRTISKGFVSILTRFCTCMMYRFFLHMCYGVIHLHTNQSIVFIIRLWHLVKEPWSMEKKRREKKLRK